MAKIKLQGSCLCGDVEYEIDADTDKQLPNGHVLMIYLPLLNIRNKLC